MPFTVESLDGRGNNQAHPSWGKAGNPYGRVGPARYADGISAPLSGPNARRISNRILNDQGQDVFSERRVSQWAWTWGQFLDHTFGLRDSTGPTATALNIDVQADDPMEAFDTSLGVISVNRSAATAGTGTGPGNPRQQTNVLASYINASPVYGTTSARQDWLRTGPLDGDPTNNRATLMMTSDNYLPRATARGNAAAAPAMDRDGRLAAAPAKAMVAGDVRANENLGLTAVQTLFAREHNRIVALLPHNLSDETKFQIARRVVVAEEQYITYQEFLPALGVALPRYTGYKPWVNTTVSDEFATVGYRAHSQINGEIDVAIDPGRYSPTALAGLRTAGVEIQSTGGTPTNMVIPLGVAFFNPDLLPLVQLGPVLAALGNGSQYNNDEAIDDQLRSVLFKIPAPGNDACLVDPITPRCFTGINDVGAIDIQRGRDHGTGTYNQLRAAYGLPRRWSFTGITGEQTDAFPADPLLTPDHEIDDPNSIDVTALFDIDGNSLPPGSFGATRDVRRTTVAARLKGVYGSTDKVDAFVGAMAEPHVPGTEFGETNLAIWTKQFTNLRDGDRFYFGNDQGLTAIRRIFGIDFKKTLAQVIAADTDIPGAALSPDVFLATDATLASTTCSVEYTISSPRRHSFAASIEVTNDTDRALWDWRLRFELSQGQSIQSAFGARFTQGIGRSNGRDITASGARFGNLRIPAKGKVTMRLTGDYDGLVNQIPANFSLNGRRCRSNH